jgi:hypothetical protein
MKLYTVTAGRRLRLAGQTIEKGEQSEPVELTERQRHNLEKRHRVDLFDPAEPLESVEDIFDTEDIEVDEDLGLDSLTVDQLKDILREAGQPVSGTKQELIDRITALALPEEE